jgi:hypothetical protein
MILAARGNELRGPAGCAAVAAPPRVENAVMFVELCDGKVSPPQFVVQPGQGTLGPSQLRAAVEE